MPAFCKEGILDRYNQALERRALLDLPAAAELRKS